MVTRPKKRDDETVEEFEARLEPHRKAQREAHRRNRADEEYREAERAANREADRRRRAEDPAYRERKRLASRNQQERQNERRRERYQTDPSFRERVLAPKRAPLPDGHPGTCDLCGALPPAMANGRRGLKQDHRHDTNAVRGWLCARCNLQVGVMDLAFTDPERFAALRAWSAKGAPAVPVKSTNPRRRRSPTTVPALFDD